MIELVATCYMPQETWREAYQRLENVLRDATPDVHDFRIGHKHPELGESRLCLVCAYEKPWGIFSEKTGETVCVECRDAARRAAQLEEVLAIGKAP
jgi:hypothetical protein